MRVEINFTGDSGEAVLSAEEVTKAVRKLFIQAEETAQAVQDIKISSAQAAESSAAAHKILSDVKDIGREARQSTRDLHQMRLASAGSGGGFGGILPGGARPRTAAYGLLGLLGAAGSGPAAGGAAALGVGALTFGGPALASIGVLVGAFHGLGKAIEGDRQAFEKLDPQAQQFVQTLRSLTPWVQKLQAISQHGLFPGVTEGLHAALTPESARNVEQAVRGISGALGELAHQAGEGLGGAQFQRFLTDLNTHGPDQILALGDAAGHLASALLTVVHAGQPVADWLARMADDGAKFVDEWLQADEATGKLSARMSSAQHELSLVAGLFGGLGDAVGALAVDLTPLGNEIIVTLTNALHGLADWLQKNHDEVVAFTTGALNALIDALKTAWPIAESLAKGLKAIVDAVGGWETAFKFVIAGGVALGIINITKAVYGLRTALLVANPELAALVVAAGLLVAFKGKAGGGGNDFGFTDSHDLPGKGGGGDFGTQPKGGNDFSTAKIGSPSKASDVGRQKLLALARSAIGSPYVWGGAGSGGFDCSGLVMWAFSNGLDMAIPHYTGDQFNKARPIQRSQLQIGDVVFSNFDKRGVPQHEALYAGGGQVIVAPHTGAKVRQESLSSFEQSSSSGVRYGTFLDSGSTDNPFKKPPPFGNDKGANLLPARLRLAMAKAGTTSGTGDDKAALNAAIKWLRGNIGDLTGEDKINAYLELASMLGQLQALATKVAKKPKKAAPSIASRASRISARGEATDLVSALTGDPFAESTAQPESLASAEKHLADVRKKLLPAIRQISKDLGDKTLTSAELSTLRAQMAQYKKTVTSAVDDVKSAIERQRGAFQSAWEKLAQTALDAFDKETSSYKSPARLLLDQLTEQHDEQQLQDALTAANEHLAKAMVGHLEDPGGVVQRARGYVAKAMFSNAVDAAQSAILGGTAQEMSGSQILKDMQQILVQQVVADPDEVAAAQKEVEEAKYQIKIHGLDKQAAAEEEQYAKDREALRTHLVDLQTEWETYFTTLKGNIEKIAALWAAALNGTSDGTYVGAGSWFGQVDPNGLPSSAGFGGFDNNGNWVGPSFDIGGPVPRTMIAQLHEGEHVIPRGGALVKTGAGGSGGDTHVHINGNIPEDWFDVQVDRAAPRIQRNLGQSTNKRIRSGRF